MENTNNTNDDNKIDLNKLSPNLAKYFNSEKKFDIQTDWKPPEFNGLNNSFQIIPKYYQTLSVKNKIIKVDYFQMIIDDIRNFRKLNEQQLIFIKNLDDERKQKIIIEFNELFDVVNSLLN
jgi:hypothetical protein